MWQTNNIIKYYSCYFLPIMGGNVGKLGREELPLFTFCPEYGSPMLQLDLPPKWWSHAVVTDLRYCCCAPVVHWFCVVIASIVVQDR